jgi:hypothetical protein
VISRDSARAFQEGSLAGDTYFSNALGGTQYIANMANTVFRIKHMAVHGLDIRLDALGWTIRPLHPVF